jgi:hypothetical protein
MNNPMALVDPTGLDGCQDQTNCIQDVGDNDDEEDGGGGAPDCSSDNTVCVTATPDAPDCNDNSTVCVTATPDAPDCSGDYAVCVSSGPSSPIEPQTPQIIAPNSVPQPTPTCKQQRILNAIPGATLTNPLDTTGQSVGEHTEFGITVTADQLQADGFSPFSIFGVNNGYRNGGVVMQVHANGSGGLVVSQAHIDTFNPASGLFGIIGHSIWDLGIGSLLQKLFPKTNGLLDPGC